MMSRIEHCWVLIGTRNQPRLNWRIKRRRHTQGHATAVQADWAWALAREETRGDVVGFWHTHVCGVGGGPSSTDVRTMRAWCLAFGKPLLCIITAGQESTAYVYENESARGWRADLSHGRERGVYLVRQDNAGQAKGLQ